MKSKLLLIVVAIMVCLTGTTINAQPDIYHKYEPVIQKGFAETAAVREGQEVVAVVVTDFETKDSLSVTFSLSETPSDSVIINYDIQLSSVTDTAEYKVILYTSMDAVGSTKYFNSYLIATDSTYVESDAVQSGYAVIKPPFRPYITITFYKSSVAPTDAIGRSSFYCNVKRN